MRTKLVCARAAKSLTGIPMKRGFGPPSILRTIQFCPKDLSTQVRQAERAVMGPRQAALCKWRRQMLASENYSQLAQRCAQLALACSAPSLAGALTMLALDYLAQSDRLNQSSDAEQRQREIQLNPFADFGD